MERFLFQKDVSMYTPAPDEKVTTVMLYSQNSLIRGELVTKDSARVSIWLRMQAQVNYVHVHRPQILLFGGPQTKSMAYEEMYFPIAQLVGFHIAPPAEEPLDYDIGEPNRAMREVNLLLGCFALKGSVRISTHTDFATSIEVAHTSWLSVYDAEIASPFMPQLPMIQTPMVLVNPMFASFGV
jgi:hypothetical protein